MVLKHLGYPYSITKTTITTAGAPHTWPTFLGALSWLRELLEYAEAVLSKPNLTKTVRYLAPPTTRSSLASFMVPMTSF